MTDSIHCVFKHLNEEYKADFNPSSTIQDLINYLHAQTAFEGKQLELVYKLKPQDPETKISTLEISENPNFIVRVIEDQTQEKKKRRKGFKIPPRDSISSDAKPPPEELEQMKASIKEVCPNASDELIEKALRVSFYCVQRACMYIIDDKVPDEAVPIKFDDRLEEHTIKENLTQEDRRNIEAICSKFKNANEFEIAQFYLHLERDQEKVIELVKGYYPENDEAQ